MISDFEIEDAVKLVTPLLSSPGYPSVIKIAAIPSRPMTAYTVIFLRFGILALRLRTRSPHNALLPESHD